MPPADVVRARVIDVHSDTPRPTDRFLLDTNVWAWEHYPSSRFTPAGGLVPQATDYRPFVQRIRDEGAARYRLVASLAELAHVVERTEYDFYVGSVASMPPKDYRHNVTSERARVVAEIQRAWALIEGDSDLLSAAHDASFAASVLAQLVTHPLDGYDAVLIAAMLAAGVTQVVTDDGDFCCVAGIEVFTANPRVLAAARAQGQLLTR